MSIKLRLYKDPLIKKARRGFQGYPAATIALYGPDDRVATKVVSGIAYDEFDNPTTEAWHSTKGDIRKDADVWEKVAQFIQSKGVKSIAMPPEILGCPHQEGIDYPDGAACPECPFWKDRPRPYGLGDPVLDEKGESPEIRFANLRSLEKDLSRFGSTPSLSPLQKAQDLMWDAWDEPNRKRRIEMARKALQISPDCADAFVMLAQETAKDHQEAIALYEQGLSAGERALGTSVFEEQAGHFWGILETRPYMRARAGLSQALAAVGRTDEAIAHNVELLRLNPNDNQGNRSFLLALYLETNRNVEASELLERYPESILAGWSYCAALLAFRMSGPGPRSSKLLKDAFSTNPHVPAYLLGEKRMPRALPEYFSPGKEDEAIIYADTYKRSWKITPSALQWLSSQQEKKA